MRTLLYVFLLLLPLQALSQQSGRYLFFNPQENNPAYYGFSRVTTFSASSSLQWTGIKDAPRYASADAAVPIAAHHALALQIASESYGAVRKQFGNVSYAFAIPVQKNQYLSMAVKLQARHEAFNTSGFSPETAYDPALIKASEGSYYGDIQAGLSFLTSRYYLGIGVSNLLGIRPGKAPERAFTEPNRFATISAGMDFTFGQLPLQIMMRAEFLQERFYRAHIGGRVYLNPDFWMGMQVSSAEKLTLPVAFRKDQWIFYYAFGFGTAPLYRKSYGSHNFGIRYRLQTKQKYRCPAYGVFKSR